MPARKNNLVPAGRSRGTGILPVRPTGVSPVVQARDGPATHGRDAHATGYAAGYTLAEILVVLVILAIAAAMVVPNIVSTSDLQAVGAARIVAADLQYAQSVAITTQVPVTVSFDPGSESYSLRNASGPLIHPINKTGYTVRFSAQSGYARLNLVSAAFGSGTNTEVTFDEMGSANNAGSVVVQAGSHVYRISVASATGKVTVTRVS